MTSSLLVLTVLCFSLTIYQCSALAGTAPPTGPSCSNVYATPTAVSSTPNMNGCTAVTFQNCLFNISMLSLTITGAGGSSISSVYIKSCGLGSTTISFVSSGMSVTIQDSTFYRGITLLGPMTVTSSSFLFQRSTLAYNSGYGSNINIQWWTQGSSLTFSQASLQGTVKLTPTTEFSNSSAFSIVSSSFGPQFVLSVSSVQLRLNSSFQAAGCNANRKQHDNGDGLLVLNSLLIQSNSSFVIYKNNFSGDADSAISIGGVTMSANSSMVFNGNNVYQTRSCPCSCQELFDISMTNADATSWISVALNKLCPNSPQFTGASVASILGSAYNYYSSSSPTRLQLGTLLSYCDMKINYQYGSSSPFQPTGSYFSNCPGNVAFFLSALCYPSFSVAYLNGTCVCRSGGGGPFCLPFNSIPLVLPTLQAGPIFVTHSPSVSRPSSSASVSVERSSSVSRDGHTISKSTTATASTSTSLTPTFLPSRSETTHSHGILPSVTKDSSIPRTLSCTSSPSGLARSRSVSPSVAQSQSMTTYSVPLQTNRRHAETRSNSSSIMSSFSGSQTSSNTDNSASRSITATSVSRSPTWTALSTGTWSQGNRTATSTASPCDADTLLLTSVLPLFLATSVHTSSLQSSSSPVNLTLAFSIGIHDIQQLLFINSTVLLPSRLVFGFSSQGHSLDIDFPNNTSLPSTPCFMIHVPSSSGKGGPDGNVLLVPQASALAAFGTPGSYARLEMNASAIRRVCWDRPVPVGSIYFLPLPPTTAEMVTSTTTATVATVSSSMQMVAANSGSNDLQVLAIIGLMGCSGTSARNAFGNYRTLSPTKLDDTFLGVVLGNFALLAGVGGVQVLLLLLLKVGALPSAVGERLIGSDAIRKGLSVSSWLGAATALRLPGLTIGAAIALYHGTIFAAGQLAVGNLDQKGNSLSSGTRVFGVVLLIVLLAVPAVMYVVSRRLYREYYALDASTYFGSMSPIKRRLMNFFAPIGFFTPEQHVRMYGPIFVAHAHQSPLWAAMPYASSWLLTLASMMDSGSPSSCTAMFASMAALHAALAAVVLFHRPYRLRPRLVIAVCQLTVTIVILVLSAVAVTKPAALSQTAIVLLGTAQAGLTAASLMCALIAVILFRRIRQEMNEERGTVSSSFQWSCGIAPTPAQTDRLDAFAESFILSMNKEHDEEEEMSSLLLMKPSMNHEEEKIVACVPTSLPSNSADTPVDQDERKTSSIKNDSLVLPMQKLQREPSKRRYRRGAIVGGMRNPLLDFLNVQEEPEEEAEEGEEGEELENPRETENDEQQGEVQSDPDAGPPPPPPVVDTDDEDIG